MTSRPNDGVSGVPGAVTATFVPRRLRTANDRRRAAWRVARWNKRHVQNSTARCADLSEAIESFGWPLTSRVQDSTSRWQPRGIAVRATAGYAGRLITFNLTVLIIHIAVLWWIFLRIGS